MRGRNGLDLAGVGRTGHFSQLEPAVQPNDGTEGMQHAHSGTGKEIKNEVLSRFLSPNQQESTYSRLLNIPSQDVILPV